MEASQYEKEYQFAIAVAMAAGAQIAQASKERMQGGGGKTSDKKNSVDLVGFLSLSSLTSSVGAWESLG